MGVVTYLVYKKIFRKVSDKTYANYLRVLDLTLFFRGLV